MLQGTGLGESGQGIARPIETKMRPGRMGIAFGGFREKTTQAREDELRHGASVSDSEEEEELEGDRKPPGSDELPGWMKRSAGGKAGAGKPRRPKIVYRTVDEVIALAEREAAQQQQAKVVDYTGPQVRTITSADIRSTPTGQAASTRFMELRHNLKLLTDMARSDVARCGKEKRLVTAQHTEADTECNQLEARLDGQQQDAARMKQVVAIVDACRAKTVADDGQSMAESMATYEEDLAKLHIDYAKEYVALSLDRFAVALFVPMMRQQLVDWSPLEQPARMAEEIEQWRSYMEAHATTTTTATTTVANREEDGYPRWSTAAAPEKKEGRMMNAYESMMYHMWLPRIRSALNAVALFERWTPLLPQFIFDTLCHQVLLPKLRRAIDHWDPRRDPVKVHTWLHPWLPVMHDWMDELWTSIRHKYAVVLQNWHPSDTSALDMLLPWQGVFQSVDMDSLLTSSIIPKLTMALRVEFEVNPQQQDLGKYCCAHQITPLEWVLAWQPMLSTTTIAQLLEQEFFPKWLELLSLWLQGKPNYDEVTEWYMYWKNLFPEEIREHPRVQDGFRRGLDLMNQMIA
ncbi:GC-rich sequence DNA-binding factor-like protein-domain-containing protein [Syncephalis pseudoplumigaleata]|uniref:GC-rich sequence DNA-binding factor-like protein-domain-containing protein n=1 Tax=Syncephalis pseudoplumigaleata TaxID=1712513 RepID=A0A4V1J1J2_9FUNG|nr:GC-rich sequence DNA-binding factor-like protein-domain-containing protein [Syncephalis pseudoplumigaleata]|eukprot:RKP25249.1 GC-rich sequence DNA-binding factor-like protein-domain-containing protein [Syncephalis pseudoplumigaleata]